MTERTAVRDIVRANLFRLIAALSGFVVASAVVLIADAPVWSKLVAALLALGSLFLIVLWLPLPWSEWTTNRGRRLVFAMAPLAAAGVLIGLGATVWGEGTQVPTEHATLILLDASGSMLIPLEDAPGPTKFDEASAQLVRHVRDLASYQLGLAAFGTGSCGSDPPAEELVSIAHDTADDIRDEAARVTPGGKANLVSAARNAIGLLQEFQDGRRLLIITGGLDRCGGDLAELVEETGIGKVHIQWEVVGLGLTDEEKEQVTDLPADVAVHFADTRADLEETLAFVLVEEPIRDQMAQLLEHVDTKVRGALNASLDEIHADPPHPEGARRQLERARSFLQSGEEQFDEFGAEDQAGTFEPVTSFLEVQFDLLEQVADGLEAVIEFDEEHGGQPTTAEANERQELRTRLEDLIKKYNDNIPELEQRIETVLKRLFEDR